LRTVCVFKTGPTDALIQEDTVRLRRFLSIVCVVAAYGSVLSDTTGRWSSNDYVEENEESDRHDRHT
jgi:hypothetical protein